MENMTRFIFQVLSFALFLPFFMEANAQGKGDSTTQIEAPVEFVTQHEGVFGSLPR